MGYKAILELGAKRARIRIDVAKINRNDGTDAYLIEIDGDELRNAGIDLTRFKEESE